MKNKKFEKKNYEQQSSYQYIMRHLDIYGQPLQWYIGNDKTYNTLGLINKKVSTFTTYYNEAQGRAVNIKNAVKKLNGKIIYSGEVFSFYKTVGPYNGSRGFIFYDKDVGSGVCQVSTTIYNAALDSLKTVTISGNGLLC